MSGLIGFGQQHAGRAQYGLGKAASLHRGRQQFNEQLDQAEDAQRGNLVGTGAGMGMMYGMQAGSVGGPVGAAIGAGIGLLASAIF